MNEFTRGQDVWTIRAPNGVERHEHDIEHGRFAVYLNGFAAVDHPVGLLGYIERLFYFPNDVFASSDEASTELNRRRAMSALIDRSAT